MIEKDFSIYNRKYKVTINGGELWRIPPYEKTGGVTCFDKAAKKLSIFLRPDSEYEEVRDSLYKITRKLNPILYLFLFIRRKVPSLLLLIPISLTVFFFGHMTIYGDLILNWAFLGENSMTIYGIPMHQAAILTAVLAVLFIYFFPVIFSGEQENFVKALNERFSSKHQLRKRLASTTRFLKSRNHVTLVELWNPDLSNEDLDWVERSLIPSLFDAGLEMHYHIRIDERHLLENYIYEIVGEALVWEDQPIQRDEPVIATPIPYEYLANWEKSMLAVYVFSSSASLSPRWIKSGGAEQEGFLNNAVSLRLVQIIFNRFKERLFSDKDFTQLISPELFASRCLNDYGVLSTGLRYNNDVWNLSEKIVQFELQKTKREMRYMISFLQAELDELTKSLDDPVAALKLNGILENNSVYNEDRLVAIRFFINIISQSEQYKVFKHYWQLIIENTADGEGSSDDIYRIIGVEQLLELVNIFERAGMYNHSREALDYVETIFPLKGKIGKSRVSESEGKFKESVNSMLEIRDDWKSGKVELGMESGVDLNLDIAWTIVSGRLEEYRSVGREVCEDASKNLHAQFDSLRDSNRIFNLFNVLANYEEWEGNPKGALDNYKKALEIPGVSQAKLSSLFVNMGIAFRQIKRLKESVQYVERGVGMKSAIGDADQLPVAFHNLAQSCIELAYTVSEKRAQMDLFSKAHQSVLKGLKIQKQTGSTKKKGQLLAEKFVSEFELVKLGEKLETNDESNLKAVQDWLRGEKEAGRAKSYDCKVVVSELLSLLTEFQGNTVEDAINWQIHH